MKPLPALALAAASLLLPQAAVAEPAKPHKNVLFIAVDDLKPTIGAFADDVALTPNIDALAARGTIFTNAHCQQAVCGPSRVSLLTGLRPDTTQVWNLEVKFRDKLPDVVTLPQTFREAGYTTITAGKIFDSRSVDSRATEDEASWSEPPVKDAAPANATIGFRSPEIVERIMSLRERPDFPDSYQAQRKMVFPNGMPATESADVPDDAYSDGAVTDLMVDRLARFSESGEPFFLAVGYRKPHLPFVAPQKYWDLYDRDSFELAEQRDHPEGAPSYTSQPGWELRNYDVPKKGRLPEDLQRELIHGYYACVSYVDAQVGELVAALEAEGLADDTAIVLWGDHGWHLGDHSIWCKHTNYEQATRSPLLFVAPGIDEPVAANDTPVEFVDVFPTLLELTGLPARDDLHGVSLVPLLNGSKDRLKDIAVSQYYRNPGGVKMGYAYRSDRYRLVRWRLQDSIGKGEIDGPLVDVELYDYQEDPLETRNLADDPAYAEALEKMNRLADAHRVSVGKPATFDSDS